VVETKERRKLQRLSWTGHAASPRRAGHAPKPKVADVLAALAGVGFGATMALAISSDSSASIAAPGGLLTAAGRIAGFAGAYLMLVMLVLIARLPWLERTVGQDRLLRWHRRIGGWPIVLIAAHIVLITLGYAQMTRTGALHQLWAFLTTYPDILAAAVAFGLLVAAGVTSVRYARRRLKYETWWIVHLYTYLALALAFAHQIATGVMFIGHPLARAVWIVVWAATAGLVIASRVVAPIVRNLRLQLRVADVTVEAPGVVSVTISGRNLSSLAVSGGQFFQWRFFASGMWWHAHPYSLSALPRPPFLRITVKASGDHSSEVAHLRPGTRVFVEGPYGAFTKHASESHYVTLVGAGVGVTPLRALLEDLPHDVDVTVLVRASTPDEIVHRDEIAHLVAEREGTFHEIVGPRHKVRFDARVLKKLAPHVASSDVYICGPEGFTGHVIAAASNLGVTSERIHHEAFAF